MPIKSLAIDKIAGQVHTQQQAIFAPIAGYQKLSAPSRNEKSRRETSRLFTPARGTASQGRSTEDTDVRGLLMS